MNRMDRYAVAGNPVEHSQSPFIHAMFAENTGEAMEYGRLLCPLDDFDATVRRFADEGGQGCNITVPFKFDACRLAAKRTTRAELAQAAGAADEAPKETPVSASSSWPTAVWTRPKPWSHDI